MTTLGSQNRLRILVVEDESVIALDIRRTLGRLGYTVVGVAASGEEAILRAAELRPDLVLMDIHLQGEIDGVEAVERILRSQDVPVVYLTAYADSPTLERARRTHPFGYLLKPFEERELSVAVEMARYRHEMEGRLRESERWLSAILRSIADGVIATDGDWRVRFMNPVAELLTGWASTEATGRDLADVLRVSLAGDPNPLPADAPLFGGGRAEGWLSARDGRRVAIEESSTTIRDDRGSVIGSVIAIRELAERRHAPRPVRSRGH